MISACYLLKTSLSRMGVGSPRLLHAILYWMRKSSTPATVSPFLRICSVTPWPRKVRRCRGGRTNLVDSVEDEGDTEEDGRLEDRGVSLGSPLDHGAPGGGDDSLLLQPLQPYLSVSVLAWL